MPKAKSAKVKGPTRDIPHTIAELRAKIHPADAINEAASRVEGQVRARGFCLAHAEALVQLIAVYADSDAEEGLAALREAFWSNPSVKWSGQETVDDLVRGAIKAYDPEWVPAPSEGNETKGT